MNEGIELAVRRWVETAVIGLNLCPFAKREWLSNRVRLVVNSTESVEVLLESLSHELDRLISDTEIETTLLIHPNTLRSFEDYNQFLGMADQLITLLKLDGVFQIASFHPEYQFDGLDANQVENYTNRSPYPILHILREESLEYAISQHRNTQEIPNTNIRRLRDLGLDHMRHLLQTCYE